MNIKRPRCNGVAVVEIKTGGRYGIGGDTRFDTACVEMREASEENPAGAQRCQAPVGEVERIVGKRR